MSCTNWVDFLVLSSTFNFLVLLKVNFIVDNLLKNQKHDQNSSFATNGIIQLNYMLKAAGAKLSNEQTTTTQPPSGTPYSKSHKTSGFQVS